MCSSSSVLTVSLCLLLCLSACLSSDVTVKPGEDATLQCQGPKGDPKVMITVIKWIKPDLESERYVFFYRENRLYEKYLHPSYRGRVELKDPEKKNRDVSVVLKNVTFSDTGKYECHVGDTKNGLKFIKAINLEVTDSGDTEERGDKDRRDKEGGDKGLYIGLAVALFVVVVVGVGGFIFYRKHRKPTEQSSPDVRYTAAKTGPPADPPADDAGGS